MCVFDQLCLLCDVDGVFFFFNQKPAYELRISDWSSDVCSSDLGRLDPDRLRLYTAELDYAERNGVATLALDGREMVSATFWWDPAFGGAAEGRRRDHSVVAAVFTDRDGGYWLHRIRYLAVDRKSTRLNSSH